MNAIIKEFLAPGRAIVVGENKEELRVSIPVNRIDLVAKSKIVIKKIRAVIKSIGETKKIDGKEVTAIEKIEFKEADIDLDAMDAVEKK